MLSLSTFSSSLCPSIGLFNPHFSHKSSRWDLLHGVILWISLLRSNTYHWSSDISELSPIKEDNCVCYERATAYKEVIWKASKRRVRSVLITELIIYVSFLWDWKLSLYRCYRPLWLMWQIYLFHDGKGKGKLRHNGCWKYKYIKNIKVYN